MGGFRGPLYRSVAAGVGCQFVADPCWLRSLFPHGPRQPLAAAYAADTADIAAADIDTAASGADIGVEFVCTAAAGPRGSSISVSMLEPAVGGWKHSLLRSTKACRRRLTV